MDWKFAINQDDNFEWQVFFWILTWRLGPQSRLEKNPVTWRPGVCCFPWWSLQWFPWFGLMADRCWWPVAACLRLSSRKTREESPTFVLISLHGREKQRWWAKIGTCIAKRTLRIMMNHGNLLHSGQAIPVGGHWHPRVIWSGYLKIQTGLQFGAMPVHVLCTCESWVPPNPKSPRLASVFATSPNHVDPALNSPYVII